MLIINQMRLQKIHMRNSPTPPDDGVFWGKSFYSFMVNVTANMRIIALTNEQLEEVSPFQCSSETTSSCVCWLHLLVVWQPVMSLFLSANLLSLGSASLTTVHSQSVKPAAYCTLQVLIVKVPDMSKGALWATSRAMWPGCSLVACLQASQVQLFCRGISLCYFAQMHKQMTVQLQWKAVSYKFIQTSACLCIKISLYLYNEMRKKGNVIDMVCFTAKWMRLYY